MLDQSASDLPDVARVEEFVTRLYRIREDAIICVAHLPSDLSFAAAAVSEEIFDLCYKRASHNALHVANGFAAFNGFSLLEETFRCLPKYASNKHRVSLTKEDIELAAAYARKWKPIDTE